MKIYTRTGDKGETGLYGGERRPKNDLRVRAYGEVDEFQAVLGVCISYGATASQVPNKCTAVFHKIQLDCFRLSSELARTETRAERNDPLIVADDVTWLEDSIDNYQKELPELKAFILQGGSPLGAHLHLARAVCRRAERAIVELAAHEAVSEVSLKYINRLSDLLFVLARYVNHVEGCVESEWHK